DPSGMADLKLGGLGFGAPLQSLANQFPEDSNFGKGVQAVASVGAFVDPVSGVGGLISGAYHDERQAYGAALDRRFLEQLKRQSMAGTGLYGIFDDYAAHKERTGGGRSDGMSDDDAFRIAAMRHLPVLSIAVKFGEADTATAVGGPDHGRRL